MKFRTCRRRPSQMPSVVCQLPLGHRACHLDARDPDFEFRWTDRLVHRWIGGLL